MVTALMPVVTLMVVLTRSVLSVVIGGGCLRCVTRRSKLFPFLSENKYIKED